jgi:hypothetical protein
MGCGGSDSESATDAAGTGATGGGGGGGGSGGSGGFGGSLGDVCAEHTPGTTADGDAVEACQKTFAERPFVRPPEDERPASGTATLYAALVASPYRFIDREGTEYLVVDENKSPMEELPSALKMPSNRDLYLVYRVTGTIETAPGPDEGSDVPAIIVDDARPAILLEGRAIDSALLGGWEGTASKRVGTNEYDETVRIPVRIQFDTTEPLEDLAEWDDPSKTLTDGERFAMVGTIQNAHDSVLASDGSCLPGLGSLGDMNPFYEATSDIVKLDRIAGMHIPGDNVLVLEYPEGIGNSGMTSIAPLSPAGLLQLVASDTYSKMNIFPHGTPNGSRIDLRHVTAGGDFCNGASH